MRHVDRNNNFGNRGAGGLWGAFMGVVLWIAIFVKGIHDLFAYVDYSFLWEFADNMLWYEPYQKFLPVKQTKLLQLWDELRIPHEESKQVFRSLMIIGFNVDPNTMTITMPAKAEASRVDELGLECFPSVATRHVDIIQQGVRYMLTSLFGSVSPSGGNSYGSQIRWSSQTGST